MNTSGIYSITAKHNGMVYVGSSVNIEKRWREHRCSLRKNYHGNGHLQRTYNKHGKDCFVWKVLEHCEKEKVLEREAYWINKLDSFHNGYNLVETPTKNMLGYRHTEETKKRMSEKKKGLRPPIAKFSDHEVRSIRQRYFDGERITHLAKEFGVARLTMRRLVYCKTYSEVEVSEKYAEMLVREAKEREDGSWKRRKGWKQDPAHVAKLKEMNSRPKLSSRRLSEEQVREIRVRREAGETCRVLASEFGVNENSISKIARRLVYKEVE